MKFTKVVSVPLFVFLLSFIDNSTAGAQAFDSLSVRVGTNLTLAGKDYQPLLISANRWGMIPDRRNDAGIFVQASNTNILSTSHSKTGDSVNHLFLRYGVSMYLNDHAKEIVAGEAYASLEYKKWALQVGRFRQQTGDIDKDLSTGSLGVSSNALPIPKISIALLDYIRFPFFKADWLQVKGSFAHGWMGDDQYLRKAFYHEKTFYMRLVLGKLKLYGGLQHFGIWGGERGNIKLDRSLDGYLNVLLVREAGDNGGLSSNYRPGRAGDQRGLIEFGADWENENVLLHLYNQTPFETGIGIDIRNIDRLAGLSVDFKNKTTGVKKFLVEFIYTKQMEDYGREVHSYYNNGNYKTGWEYEDRIIGTPLFHNRIRANHYFPSIVPYDWHNQVDSTIIPNTNIVNNRVVGLNLGLMFNINGQFRTKTNLVATKNYGSRDVTEYRPSMNQYYTLQELMFQPTGSRWLFNVGAAVDFGDLGSNVGGLVQVSYRIL